MEKQEWTHADEAGELSRSGGDSVSAQRLALVPGTCEEVDE